MSEQLQSLNPLVADALRSMDRQDWMGRLWAIVNQAHAAGFAEGLQRVAIVKTEVRDELDVCEHGVQCGDWCEPCNKAYKAALVENALIPDADRAEENGDVR